MTLWTCLTEQRNENPVEQWKYMLNAAQTNGVRFKHNVRICNDTKFVIGFFSPKMFEFRVPKNMYYTLKLYLNNYYYLYFWLNQHVTTLSLIYRVYNIDLIFKILLIWLDQSKLISIVYQQFDGIKFYAVIAGRIIAATYNHGNVCFKKKKIFIKFQNSSFVWDLVMWPRLLFSVRNAPRIKRNLEWEWSTLNFNFDGGCFLWIKQKTVKSK